MLDAHNRRWAQNRGETDQVAADITYLRRTSDGLLTTSNIADLHPDHQIVHEEVLISLFHAQGNIWPELGEPIAEVPQVYEFACYCDFPRQP